MEDTQSLEDHRKISIQNVGIKNLKYPSIFYDIHGGSHAITSVWELGVSLSADKKGTHMSRLVEMVHEWRTRLTFKNLSVIAKSVQEKLDANHAFIKINFTYFVDKASPVTKHQSFMDYAVCLYANTNTTSTECSFTISIPVTTLCPCSKSISEFGAHNQRGQVDIRIVPDGDISFEDIIRHAETSASSELYAVLKREDEKFVTERGKILPRRISGNCASHQRSLTVAIKRARDIALMAYTADG